MRYFDIHSHIHGGAYDDDRTEVISRMREAGVSTIVIGTDKSESQKAVELAEREENIYAAIGQHPTDRFDEEFDENFYREMLQHKKVVAVGECGLDYYRPMTHDAGKTLDEEKKRQKELFIKQLNLAVEFDKPLMIHCRPSENGTDAHDDMIAMLEEAQKNFGEKVRGNIHFFTGSLEIAQKYIALGFTISIPGVVTFARALEKMVEGVPLENMMSETDSPYAAPVPHRGKRNEPAFVVHIVDKIARLKKVDSEVVREAIVKNVSRVFGI